MPPVFPSLYFFPYSKCRLPFFLVLAFPFLVPVVPLFKCQVCSKSEKEALKLAGDSLQAVPLNMLNLGRGENRKRAEICLESTVSEKRTHWVLGQTRWVLRKTRWVRSGTQIIGWEELTEFAPRNLVRAKNLTEFGVWNRTLRNRIRPVSEKRPPPPHSWPE